MYWITLKESSPGQAIAVCFRRFGCSFWCSMGEYLVISALSMSSPHRCSSASKSKLINCFIWLLSSYFFTPGQYYKKELWFLPRAAASLSLAARVVWKCPAWGPYSTDSREAGWRNKFIAVSSIEAFTSATPRKIQKYSSLVLTILDFCKGGE